MPLNRERERIMANDTSSTTLETTSTKISTSEKLDEFVNLMKPSEDIPSEKIPRKFAESMSRILPVDTLIKSNE